MGLLEVRVVTSGFVAAFDKHWNMALTDVDEQFTRNRSREAPVLGKTWQVVIVIYIITIWYSTIIILPVPFLYYVY